MKEIQLSKGLIALVDDDDFEKVNVFKWSATVRKNQTYALGYVRGSGRKNTKYIYLHRLITDAPKGYDVDHINGNGLDNRKENLRVVTRSQNNMNRKVTKNKNNYKGVTFHAGKGKFEANIKRDGVVTYLGSYGTPEEAGEAYNKKALELFGEYANLNKLGGQA